MLYFTFFALFCSVRGGGGVVSLTATLAPTAADSSDTPCGCEIDGVSFCNFDFGATGLCEQCPDDVQICFHAGLPDRGAQDCASRCSGPTRTLCDQNYFLAVLNGESKELQEACTAAIVGTGTSEDECTCFRWAEAFGFDLDCYWDESRTDTIAEAGSVCMVCAADFAIFSPNYLASDFRVSTALVGNTIWEQSQATFLSLPSYLDGGTLLSKNKSTMEENTQLTLQAPTQEGAFYALVHSSDGRSRDFDIWLVSHAWTNLSTSIEYTNTNNNTKLFDVFMLNDSCEVTVSFLERTKSIAFIHSNVKFAFPTRVPLEPPNAPNPPILNVYYLPPPTCGPSLPPTTPASQIPTSVPTQVPTRVPTPNQYRVPPNAQVVLPTERPTRSTFSCYRKIGAIRAMEVHENVMPGEVSSIECCLLWALRGNFSFFQFQGNGSRCMVTQHLYGAAEVRGNVSDASVWTSYEVTNNTCEIFNLDGSNAMNRIAKVNSTSCNISLSAETIRTPTTALQVTTSTPSRGPRGAVPSRSPSEKPTQFQPNSGTLRNCYTQSGATPSSLPFFNQFQASPGEVPSIDCCAFFTIRSDDSHFYFRSNDSKCVVSKLDLTSNSGNVSDATHWVLYSVHKSNCPSMHDRLSESCNGQTRLTSSNAATEQPSTSTTGAPTGVLGAPLRENSEASANSETQAMAVTAVTTFLVVILCCASAFVFYRYCVVGNAAQEEKPSEVEMAPTASSTLSPIEASKSGRSEMYMNTFPTASRLENDYMPARFSTTPTPLAGGPQEREECGGGDTPEELTPEELTPEELTLEEESPEDTCCNLPGDTSLTECDYMEYRKYESFLQKEWEDFGDDNFENNKKRLPNSVPEEATRKRKFADSGNEKRSPSGSLKKHAPMCVAGDQIPGEILITDSCDIDEQMLLGEGNFGKVLLGTYRGARCCFKMLNNSDESYVKEGSLLFQTTRHPAVCRFYGFFHCSAGDHYFLVLEHFYEGSLLDAMTRKFEPRRFNVDQKIEICHMLTTGLWHVSSKDVIHGDLALRNCLLHSITPSIKVGITDFGLSSRQPCLLPRKVLSPRWCAPELFQSKKITFETDIWALGCVFCEIFADGKKPYYEKPQKEVIMGVSKGKLNPILAEGIPKFLRGLLLKMFNTNPELRPDIETIERTLRDNKKLHDAGQVSL